MKQLKFVIMCFFFHTACSEEKKSSSELSALSVQFAEGYASYELKNIEHLLTDSSKLLAQKIYAQSAEEQVATIQMVKNSDKKITSRNILGDTAIIEMCCNNDGDKFKIFWIKENGEWKVDLNKLIESSLEKSQ